MYLKGRMTIFSKINKRAGPNKWGGWKIFEKLINGETLIRLSRVEKIPKINKRACPFIRDLRVRGKSCIYYGLRSN